MSGGCECQAKHRVTLGQAGESAGESEAGESEVGESEEGESGNARGGGAGRAFYRTLCASSAGVHRTTHEPCSLRERKPGSKPGFYCACSSVFAEFRRASISSGRGSPLPHHLTLALESRRNAYLRLAKIRRQAEIWKARNAALGTSTHPPSARTR